MTGVKILLALALLNLAFLVSDVLFNVLGGLLEAAR
jgi:hypothetical protein